MILSLTYRTELIASPIMFSIAFFCDFFYALYWLVSDVACNVVEFCYEVC